jgi:GGDEF domain-containing protein
VTPEDELIELAARRARTAMADEKTGFGNLLQFLRDVTRQLARSRRTGEAFDLIVFETDAELDPSRIAARLRPMIRDEDVVARIGSQRYALVVCDSGSDDGQRAVDLLVRRLGSVSRFALGRRVVVASDHAPATPLGLLQEATAALRRARKLSHDRVVTWQGSAGSIN